MRHVHSGFWFDQKPTEMHPEFPRQECDVPHAMFDDVETPKVAKWTRGEKNERHAARQTETRD